LERERRKLGTVAAWLLRDPESQRHLQANSKGPIVNITYDMLQPSANITPKQSYCAVCESIRKVGLAVWGGLESMGRARAKSHLYDIANRMTTDPALAATLRAQAEEL